MDEPGKRPRNGRPPIPFNEDVALHICVELASGRPLTRICKEDDVPSLVTIYKWLMENEKFAKDYARAREDQADTLADETLTIADEVPASSDKGNIDQGAVQHQKLRVDTRKWVAAKMRPKKYSERHEITNADGVPFVVQIAREDEDA
jgi:hypothetical protein